MQIYDTNVEKLALLLYYCIASLIMHVIFDLIFCAGSYFDQVGKEDALLFAFDKIRRPVAEDKAIVKAIQLIEVIPPPPPQALHFNI